MAEKMNKNVRNALNAVAGAKPKPKTTWVFTTFSGKGTAKYPYAGFATMEEAQEAAEAINGYIISLQPNQAAGRK